MAQYHQKIKNEFDRAYIPILVASIILGILTISLVAVIFFMSEDEVSSIKAPKYKSLYISKIDAVNNSKMNSLRNLQFDKVSVKFKLLKQYHKKNIDIYGIKTKLIDKDEIIISSDNKGNKNYTDFISKANSDGDIEWITPIKDSSYRNLTIYDVFKYKDDYYTVGTGIKGGKKYLLGIKIAANGSISKIERLTGKVDGDIYYVAQTEDMLAIVFKCENNIKVSLMSYDLKLEEDIFDFADDNIFPKASIHFYGYENIGNNLIICLNFKDYLGTYKLKTNDYILSIDAKDGISELIPVNNITNKLDKMIERKAYVVNDNILYLTDKNKIEVRFLNGNIKREYDYSKIELEENDKYIVSEGDSTNNISIVSVNENMITLETNFSRIYDFVDKNLEITKRYVKDLYKNQFDGGVFHTLYTDNKLIEIYNYWSASASLLMFTIMG